MSLCAVLLRLCKPFSEPRSPKLLKVQPTYRMATGGNAEERRRRNIHMTSKNCSVRIVFFCSCQLISARTVLSTTTEISLIFVTVLCVVDLAEETCLIPQSEAENERLQPEENYNFMSECFYMTHRCINLGFIILILLTNCMRSNEESHMRKYLPP